MADHPSQDRRARRSRAALRAALLDLITERGLNRIAVSDVTKRADVNRSTFYEHYSDVHELAADACTRMFDELIAAGVVEPAPRKAPRTLPKPIKIEGGLSDLVIEQRR